MKPAPTGTKPTYRLRDGRPVMLLDREGLYRDALIPYTPTERLLARDDRTHHLQRVNVLRLIRRDGRRRTR